MKKAELFFLGISAALAALFLEALIYLIFFLPEIIRTATVPEITFSLGFLLSSALIEELLKNSILYKKITGIYSTSRTTFISLFLGLGFALTEVSLLYFKLGNQLFDSFMLIVGIVIIHIITAMIAGYFLVTQKQRDLIILSESIIITTIIHFAYNYFIYLF